MTPSNHVELVERSRKLLSEITPGPWRVRENSRHAPDECDLSICGDIFVLADIGGPNYQHCEAETPKGTNL